MIDFLFFEKANFPAIRPLMRRLLALGRRATLVKGFDYKELSGEIEPFVVPPEIPRIDIRDFFRDQDEDEVEAYAQGALTRFAPARARRGWSGIFFQELEEKPYWPFLLRHYRRVELALRRYYRERRPQLVVVPEDVHYLQGRMASRTLRAEGARILAWLPLYYQSIASTPLLGERMAGRYVVMDEDAARRLRLAGAPARSISIRAYPAFEELPRRERASRRSLYFVCQGKPWEPVILNDLIAILGEAPDVSLVIKGHPELGDAPPLPELPPNVTWRSTSRMADCFHEAAGVIATSSGALYEARELGLPILVVDYSGLPPESRLAYGQAACARTFSELRREIGRLVERSGA